MRLPLETLYAYPAARLVDVDVSNQALVSHLSGSSNARRPIALYVHIPFCVHFCHFCGFVKAKYSAKAAGEYVGLLCQEIQNVSRISGHKRKVDAVYFGGGTASTLSLDGVSSILGALQQSFEIDDEAELTFEGDALTLSKSGYLQGLAAMGFNRLSFGVQIGHLGARNTLNLKPRLQSLASLSHEASDLFPDVCVDYMYGWPGFSSKASADDLAHVLSLIKPTSVELFRFEILDASPLLARKFSEYLGGVHDCDVRATHDSCASALEDAGYDRKSYTLFSRHDLSLKYYNSYYGWDGRGLIGFGLGAQSFFEGVMWGAVGDLESYSHLVWQGQIPSDTLSTFSSQRKELITWPRRGWIAHNVIQRADESYRDTMAEFVRRGFVEAIGDRWVLRPAHWYDAAEMMHTFLSPLEREEIELTSNLKAAERGFLPREEERCVTKV